MERHIAISGKGIVNSVKLRKEPSTICKHKLPVVCWQNEAQLLLNAMPLIKSSSFQGLLWRPHQSLELFNFHRGIGLTIKITDERQSNTAAS
jgi:hypothetical protein